MPPGRCYAARSVQMSREHGRLHMVKKEEEEDGCISVETARPQTLNRPGQELFRQLFRQLRYHESSGPLETLSRLQELCRWWMRPDVLSKAQMLELLVLEQFLSILPGELRTWVQLHCPESGAEVVALLEELQRDLDGTSLKMVMGSPPEKTTQTCFIANYMSRSQLEQEKKFLDSFVWVNEITGETTFPPGEGTTPAASGEKRPARSRSPRGNIPCSVAAHRPASPVNPEAVGRGPGTGSLLLPDLGMPRVLSPPGSALPTQDHLGVSPPLARVFPASPSPPWALSCKLRNVLTGNNRFSF